MGVYHGLMKDDVQLHYGFKEVQYLIARVFL